MNQIISREELRRAAEEAALSKNPLCPLRFFYYETEWRDAYKTAESALVRTIN